MAINKEQGSAALIGSLLEVWNASVRASHHFLTDGDIRRLSAYAEQALCHIRHLIVAEDGPVPVGFMGVERRKSQ